MRGRAGGHVMIRCLDASDEIAFSHPVWYNRRLWVAHRARPGCDEARQMPEMLWKVDMHSHTRLSKDSLNNPRLLVETAARRGLGAICVTDHNGLANALALAALPD